MEYWITWRFIGRLNDKLPKPSNLTGHCGMRSENIMHAAPFLRGSVQKTNFITLLSWEPAGEPVWVDLWQKNNYNTQTLFFFPHTLMWHILHSSWLARSPLNGAWALVRHFCWAEIDKHLESFPRILLAAFPMKNRSNIQPLVVCLKWQIQDEGDRTSEIVDQGWWQGAMLTNLSWWLK